MARIHELSDGMEKGGEKRCHLGAFLRACEEERERRAAAIHSQARWWDGKEILLISMALK